MDICISFIAGLFLIGMIKQVVYFVEARKHVRPSVTFPRFVPS